MSPSGAASRVRAHLLLPLAIALVALAALALPAAAGAAIQLQIVNETGREDVYVTVHGAEYDVEGAAEDEEKLLSSDPGTPLNLTVNKLISGRVYVSFGQPVKEGVTLESPTRFDWAELTVTPAAADQGNLTSVDQFGIAMRMEAVEQSGQTEALSMANADTIFNALQQIPGGAAATVRNAQNEIIRVISPVHSSAYPGLGEYVKSLSGQTLTLHTGLYQTPTGIAQYSGGVNADGSVTLNGSYVSSGPLAEPPPPTITIPAAQLLSEIYAPTTEHNNFEAAIKRDLLAGFSSGFWGGAYGDDSLAFCTQPLTKEGLTGEYCPKYDKPGFGAARAGLSPFPTCNQYAATINQYSDAYSSAYTDDTAKKVTVSLDQEHADPEEDTRTLRLTILPDSGSSAPTETGNPNCGAAAPAPAPAAGGGSGGGSAVHPKAHFVKKAKVKKGKARIARLRCGTACGQVKAVVKHGKKVVAKVKRGKVKAAKPWVVVHLTKPGKRLLGHSHRLTVRANLFVRPAGGKWSRFHNKLKLIAP